MDLLVICTSLGKDLFISSANLLIRLFVFSLLSYMDTIYYGCQPLIRYTICKYLLQIILYITFSFCWWFPFLFSVHPFKICKTCPKDQAQTGCSKVARWIFFDWCWSWKSFHSSHCLAKRTSVSEEVSEKGRWTGTGLATGKPERESRSWPPVLDFLICRWDSSNDHLLSLGWGLAFGSRLGTNAFITLFVL